MYKDKIEIINPRALYGTNRIEKLGTAATYLNSLVDAGLLEFEKVGRESINKNTRLIDLLSNF